MCMALGGLYPPPPVPTDSDRSPMESDGVRRTPMGLFLALGSVKFTVPWDYFPRFLYNSHQTPSHSGAGLIGVRWSPMESHRTPVGV